jgi:hypothetical protein
MWARLQKAEFLWQTGHFEEADEVYGTLDPEKLPSKELLLRYFVGRARESAQRRDHPRMRVFLDEAVAILGTDDCFSDPLFLHASAGLKLETGEQVEAVPIAARAERLADASHLWKHYPMIASRASALALECGSVRLAAQLSTRAVAAAAALGSERMVALAMSFLASCEVQLGSAGSVLRRRELLLRTGVQLDDGLLILSYHRVGLYVASIVGLRGLAAESVEAMAKFSNINHAPVIDEHMGLLELGAENWETARSFAARAAEGYKALTQRDGEAACWAYCSLAEWRLGNRDEALRRFQIAREFFELGKYPYFNARYLLIKCEVGAAGSPAEADSAFNELQAAGRAADLVMWAPLLVKHCSSSIQIEVRKSVLAAIRKTADSFESAALRSEFLSFLRTRRALLAIQGS